MTGLGRGGGFVLHSGCKTGSRWSVEVCFEMEVGTQWDFWTAKWQL